MTVTKTRVTTSQSANQKLSQQSSEAVNWQLSVVKTVPWWWFWCVNVRQTKCYCLCVWN